MKTTTGSTGTTKTTVQFVYDAEGEPLLLRFNGKTDYFYLYNGLGDIVGLIDSSNKVVVRYQYDSWGKVTSSEDTSGVSLATLNPFCYRKYVFNQETGLYCLGSRYYDPEVGRFVNADDFETLTYQMDSVQGKNLYQYCFNNLVNMEDEDGGWPKWGNRNKLIGNWSNSSMYWSICINLWSRKCYSSKLFLRHSEKC